MKIDVRMTPDELQNMIDAVAEAGDARDYCVDDTILTELLEIVDAALTSMGINIVEDDDDEDEPNEMEFDCEGDCANCPDPCPEYTGEEKEEEEEPDNPVAQCVFMYGGKRAIKESDADDIFEGAQKAVNKVFGVLPVEVRQKILSATLVKLFEENGIEVVLKGV